MARKKSHKHRKHKHHRKPEGVVSRSELREAFQEAWEKCGHPRQNRKCWRRILRKAWSDV